MLNEYLVCHEQTIRQVGIRLYYMDVQEWAISWDDEDTVDDFSEILKREKELIR